MNNDMDLKKTIVEESNNRRDMLEQVEKSMFTHTNKLREYEEKSKQLDILKIKYLSLERETSQEIEILKNSKQKDTETIDNLQSEVQVLRKTILNYKSKVSSLISIIELMVNDFGLEQVSLATGISTDKIKEYLQDKS